LAAIVRFAIVGVFSTLVYLGASLVLLGWGMAPQPTNLIGFLLGTATSYGGHYFFTYRSGESHLRLGTRFFLLTGGLALLCSGLHQMALLFGADPRFAALFVTLTYPPLSFGLNHFWAFARGAGGAASQ
jgi:putative flippase GtrA